MNKIIIKINEKLSDIISYFGMALLLLLGGAAAIALIIAISFALIMFVSLFTYFPIRALISIISSIFQ